MKTGHISKQLGVSTQSIRRWTERFGEFLSAESQRHQSYQATYTNEDVLVFATIHYLSSQGIGLEEIERRLRAGYRINDSLFDLFRTHQLAPLEQAEKALEEDKQASLEMQKLILERDYVLETVRKLEQQVENLLRENAALQYRLGSAEGELNSLRRQLEKQLG